MIIYTRTINVALPKGALGHLKAIQAEVEERFSNKDRFIDWYNDNHEIKIDSTIASKFERAPKMGEVIYRFLDTNHEKVFYKVVS